MKKKARILGLAALIALLVSSCSKEEYQTSIPSVPFVFTCSLLQNPYYKLQTPGQFIKVEKNVYGIAVGYAGLIIGKSVYDVDGDIFYAYDAACPVEANKGVSINLVDDGLGTAVCPKCKTKYYLSSGGYPEGIGTEYLKRYNVIVSGTNLQVSN